MRPCEADMYVWLTGGRKSVPDGGSVISEITPPNFNIQPHRIASLSPTIWFHQCLFWCYHLSALIKHLIDSLPGFSMVIAFHSIKITRFKIERVMLLIKWNPIRYRLSSTSVLVGWPKSPQMLSHGGDVTLCTYNWNWPGLQHPLFSLDLHSNAPSKYVHNYALSFHVPPQSWIMNGIKTLGVVNRNERIWIQSK